MGQIIDAYCACLPINRPGLIEAWWVTWLKKNHNTAYKLFYWWNRWDFAALLRLGQSRAGFYGGSSTSRMQDCLLLAGREAVRMHCGMPATRCLLAAMRPRLWLAAVLSLEATPPVIGRDTFEWVARQPPVCRPASRRGNDLSVVSGRWTSHAINERSGMGSKDVNVPILRLSLTEPPVLPQSQQTCHHGGVNGSKNEQDQFWNRFILDICTRLSPYICEKDGYAPINVLKHLF